MSTVTGRSVLYPDQITTTNYYNYNIKCCSRDFLPRREVEEDTSEALLIVDNYNLLLYNAAATSVALLLMLYV